MKVYIQPICPADVPGILEDHFPDRFRLILPQDRAHWFGSGPEYERLWNPVRREPFQNLLEGRTTSGLAVRREDQFTPERVVAWRFTFRTWKGDLLNAGCDLSDAVRLRVAQVTAVSAALRQFDTAMQSATDLPPWEEPPKFFFATFRGEHGRLCPGHLATTVYFANLNYIPHQPANICRAEVVAENVAMLEPTYAQHLTALLPPRAQPRRLPRLAAQPAPERQAQPAAPTALRNQPASDPARVRRHGRSH